MGREYQSAANLAQIPTPKDYCAGTAIAATADDFTLLCSASLNEQRLKNEQELGLVSKDLPKCLEEYPSVELPAKTIVFRDSTLR